MLLLATGLVFGRLAGAEFTTWDDPHTLRDNPDMRPPTLAGLSDYWRVTTDEQLARGQAVNHRASLWVPLTYSAWLAVATFAQVPSPTGGTELNPYLFHIANIAVHALSGIIVYFMLLRLFESRAGAMFGAMLFLLHPLQVEPVAWASGLKDLLAGALSLAAILLYLTQAAADRALRRRRLAWWCSLALLGMAMLAKPSAVAVPVLLVVIDLLVLRRGMITAATSAAPFFALTLPIILIARIAQTGADVPPVAWLLRPVVALDAMSFYLGKLIWPANLCIDYGRTPAMIVQSSQINWTWIAPVLLIAACLFQAFSRRKTNQPSLPAASLTIPLAAVLVFLLAPLPVLGFVPFTFQNYSTTADHYVYLAMLGPAMLIAHWFRSPPPMLARGAAIAAIGTLAVTSFAQTKVWMNSRALFEHTVAVNPSSGPGLHNLGALAAERNDLDTAAGLFRRALPTQPNASLTYRNLRQVLTARTRTAEAQEVAQAEYRYRSRGLIARTGHVWLDPNHAILRAIARGQEREAIELAEKRLRSNGRDIDTLSLAMLAEQIERTKSYQQ